MNHSYESVIEQMVLLRAAVVYARQALAVPRTEREIEAALILDKARAEADKVMKEHLMRGQPHETESQNKLLMLKDEVAVLQGQIKELRNLVMDTLLTGTVRAP